jgi:hypothetical protein
MSRAKAIIIGEIRFSSDGLLWKTAAADSDWAEVLDIETHCPILERP